MAGGVDELFHDVYERLAQMGALSPMRGRRGRGLPALRGRSQRPGAGRGRHLPRARGAGGGAGARRADHRRDRGDRLGQRAGRAPHRPPAGGRDPGSPVARLIRERGTTGLSRAATAPATATPRWTTGSARCWAASWPRPTTWCRRSRWRRSSASTAGSARCAWARPRWTRRAARPRCSCTASRAAAAGPRWWWSRPRESGQRAPDRHPGLQRGRHHRRHRGAARGCTARCWWWTTARPTAAPRWPPRPARTSSRWAGGGARARRCVTPSPRRARAGSSGVVTLDGDGQHDPDDIPRLLKAAVEEPGALVIGGRLGRLADAPAQVMPAGRLAALRVAGFFIDWLGGVPVADTQSGFRVYPARLLAAVTPRHGGFVLESEMLLRAAAAGLPHPRDPDHADPLRGPAQPLPPGARRPRGRGLPGRPHRGALGARGRRGRALRHRDLQPRAPPGAAPGDVRVRGAAPLATRPAGRSPSARSSRIARSGPSRTAGAPRTRAACAWPPWPPPRPRSCSRSG